MSLPSVDSVLIGVTSPITEPVTSTAKRVQLSIDTYFEPDSGVKSSPTPDAASSVATSPSSPLSDTVLISPAAALELLLHFLPLSSQPVKVTTTLPTVVALV